MRDIRRGRSNPSWRAVNRFAKGLRAWGFWPTLHFAERFLERIGGGHPPAAFSRAFARARHYRDARPGRNNRVAVVEGIPVVYRRSGRRGRQVKLITVLPAGVMPPYLSPAARTRRWWR